MNGAEAECASSQMKAALAPSAPRAVVDLAQMQGDQAQRSTLHAGVRPPCDLYYLCVRPLVRPMWGRAAERGQL